MKTARNFRDKGDVINAVEISLQDIAQAEELAAQISSWGYNAKSWQENNPEIMRAINIGGFWTRFSVLLFMVVAFFGVASIMNLLWWRAPSWVYGCGSRHCSRPGRRAASWKCAL